VTSAGADLDAFVPLPVTYQVSLHNRALLWNLLHECNSEASWGKRAFDLDLGGTTEDVRMALSGMSTWHAAVS